MSGYRSSIAFEFVIVVEITFLGVSLIRIVATAAIKVVTSLVGVDLILVSAELTTHSWNKTGNRANGYNKSNKKWDISSHASSQ
jgi:hypothetical protein